ncbi:MAG: hypothetical protein COB02_07595 [Candidatus Cloacimonadota bacterium]|nr:MAG: hypothetical protein COB02_07595 [Candidatus Cloacimonadota bacterium]
MAFNIEDLYDGITISSGNDGNNYLILICIHGNETCGLEAILSLQKSGELKSLLKSGTLSILLANPKAYEQKRRYINCDLNRSIAKNDLKFDYEIQRSKIVEKYIENADFVLDIHSTSGPSVSHALPCDLSCSENFAKTLPVNYLITKLAHLTVEGGTTLDFAKKQNSCAVTIECGQHEDKKSIEVAISCIKQLFNLKALINPSLIMLECLKSFEVKKGFLFKQNFSCFDFVKYGQEIASDDLGTITCTNLDGGYIIMPNSSPKIGEEAFFWAISK